MKLKGDFITNSSSTAFFFIFNGDKKEDLFNLIIKYKHKFDQSVDYGCGDNKDIRFCNAGYVIDSIDDVITTNEPYDESTKCKIEPIKKLIKEYKNDMDYWEKAYKKEIKRSKTEKITYDLSKDYKEHEKKYRDGIKVLKEAESKGLTSYINIEFGDNHGHVCGENASAMDYNGDDMIIKENDFYLLTENHH
jgi:hypothetical protein